MDRSPTRASLMIGITMALVLTSCIATPRARRDEQRVRPEPLQPARVLVIMAYGEQGLMPLWNIRIDAEGTIYERGRELDDAQLAGAFRSARGTEPFTVGLHMSSEEKTTASALSAATSRLVRAAIVERRDETPVVIYVFTQEMRSLPSQKRDYVANDKTQP